MTDLFLKVLEMSLTGSVVILVTMLARFILRKRSKRFIMILWAVVALRMLVPVSFESPISVFNYIHFDADVLSEQVRELPAIEAFLRKKLFFGIGKSLLLRRINIFSEGFFHYIPYVMLSIHKMIAGIHPAVPLDYKHAPAGGSHCA